MATLLHKFLFEHKIFSFEEFAQAVGNPVPTCRAMLTQHLKTGNIIRIKQGLYASIPAGADPHTYPVDPYAVISAITQDAVIAYHTALQFHGAAHSLHFQYVFQSTHKIRDFIFREDRFKAVQYSKLLPTPQRFIFVDEIDHHGFMIQVTSIERTFVDALDKIELSGGLEEVSRSLNSIQHPIISHIIEYALLLNNATTIAKVGFFLRLHQKEWAIPEHYFTQLKKHLPRSVHYLDRKNRHSGKYIKEWRIIIPHELFEQQWEELLEASEL